MTWICPNCERKYPDSGIGLPMDADADEKTCCNECFLRRGELRELANEWNSVEFTSDGIRGAYWLCADELEAVLEDE